jgi:hypothetical protein
MFNVVRSPGEFECSLCHHRARGWIQFAFGAGLMARYEVGDRISWDGVELGEPGHHLVAVQGLGQRCPNCGHDDDPEFDIVIRDDIIESVTSTTGTTDYLADGRYYWATI